MFALYSDFIEFWLRFPDTLAKNKSKSSTAVSSSHIIFNLEKLVMKM